MFLTSFCPHFPRKWWHEDWKTRLLGRKILFRSKSLNAKVEPVDNLAGSARGYDGYVGRVYPRLGCPLRSSRDFSSFCRRRPKFLFFFPLRGEVACERDLRYNWVNCYYFIVYPSDIWEHLDNLSWAILTCPMTFSTLTELFNRFLVSVGRSWYKKRFRIYPPSFSFIPTSS